MVGKGLFRDCVVLEVADDFFGAGAADAAEEAFCLKELKRDAKSLIWHRSIAAIVAVLLAVAAVYFCHGFILLVAITMESLFLKSPLPIPDSTSTTHNTMTYLTDAATIAAESP